MWCFVNHSLTHLAFTHTNDVFIWHHENFTFVSIYSYIVKIILHGDEHDHALEKCFADMLKSTHLSFSLALSFFLWFQMYKVKLYTFKLSLEYKIKEVVSIKFSDLSMPSLLIVISKHIFLEETSLEVWNDFICCYFLYQWVQTQVLESGQIRWATSISR